MVSCLQRQQGRSSRPLPARAEPRTLDGGDPPASAANLPPPSVVLRLIARLVAAARAAEGAVARGWGRESERAKAAALRQLSDRELKDLGIGRSEIPYATTSPEFERQRCRLRRPRGSRC